MAWLPMAPLAAAALLAGWKGGRVAMLVAAAIALGWLATAAVVARDPRDGAGFFDCGVDCTTSQDIVAFVAFAGPVVLVLLLLGTLAGYLARRSRS
jgi:hypothetical protein